MTEVLVVSADAAVVDGPALLPPLTRLLGERIACYLRDRVWIVRLAWGAPLPLPASPPTEARIDLVDPVTDLRDFIDGFLLAWGSAVDLLLIDPGALFDGSIPLAGVNPLLVGALAGIGAPARLGYVISDPQQWHDLPFTVGPLPSAIDVLPTVLLPDGPPDDGPGAAWMALFDDLAGLNFPTPAAAGAAFVDLALGIARFYGSGGGSAAGDPARAWPLDAVKLRLTSAFRTALLAWTGPVALDLLPLAADARVQVRLNLERWARAATARRVGLALGGGGALSYVGVAFLEELAARAIPVDIVGGTSFGSIVAAYYAVRGAAGLQAIVRHWYWAQLTVALGWLTGDFLQLWIDLDLGFSDINDLEVTFLPVAANAYTGHPWLLRIGVVGHTCCASGSLPPLSPTYDGNLRLLDGALSAVVPAAVVGDAGAQLVAGANVVPYPPQLPPDPALPLPWLWNTLRSLNPVRRFLDFGRGYEMLLRQGGHSQDTHADVVYAADTSGVDGAAFYAGQAIVDQALASTPFQLAVGQLEQRWLDLLVHLPGRIRYWYLGDDVYLGGDIEPGAATAGPLDAIGFSGPALDLAAPPYLARIAALLHATPWLSLFIRVDRTGNNLPLYQQQCQALRDALIVTHGIAPARVGDEIRYGAGVPVERTALQIWLGSAVPPVGLVTHIP